MAAAASVAVDNARLYKSARNREEWSEASGQVTAALLGAYLTAHRLDRLHIRTDLARAALAGALERREPWGVWGGQLFVQGSVVARKRPRGRPRKDGTPARSRLGDPNAA